MLYNVFIVTLKNKHSLRLIRREAEATPKTMSFMHLHLGVEGPLPDGTDVRFPLAVLPYLFSLALVSHLYQREIVSVLDER